METKWSFIDKTAWGEGEWHNEPDKIQWTDEATGLPCLIVRQKTHGALCGYVGVPESHPLFKKEYGQAPCFDVHGGLTFSNLCQEDQEHGICHVPAPGEPDVVWWYGFDCAHAFDHVPHSGIYGLSSFGMSDTQQYRNVAYVKKQCAELAEQLKAAQ